MSSDDQDSRESRDQTTPSADEPDHETEGVASDASDAPEESASGAEEKPAAESDKAPEAEGEPSTTKGETPAAYYDDPYDEYEHNYQEPSKAASTAVTTTTPEAPKSPPPPPPPVDTEEEEDGEEDGMVRMSFLEHLEELRTRIIRALVGLVVAYAIALTAKNYLFRLMRAPFDAAVEAIRLNSPDVNIQLVALTPIEQFHLIWLKLPIVAAVFMAAPWWMYQVWGFVAPGLYRKERRWASPFILCGSALFILGGVFGYFVALKFALAFLLDVGGEEGVQPLISINAYYSMFVSIMLGLGVVFQMPIVIFVLTTLRIASPSFLMGNVRYAILAIFVLAAVITPTPDIFNMITFATPMILLFYVGIGVSYVFLLRREGKSLPWGKIMLAILLVLAIIAVIIYYLHTELGYQFVREFPWFVAPTGQ